MKCKKFCSSVLKNICNIKVCAETLLLRSASAAIIQLNKNVIDQRSASQLVRIIHATNSPNVAFYCNSIFSCSFYNILLLNNLTCDELKCKNVFSFNRNHTYEAALRNERMPKELRWITGSMTTTKNHH